MLPGVNTGRDSPDAPRLFGREREIRLLVELLDRALGGHGSTVLVSGEAGIGKTALVQRLVSESKERGALVLSGAAYDLSATPPYGPWLELAERYPVNADLPEVPEVLKRGTGVGDFQSQLEIFAFVRDFFMQVSQARPLVLVLEDIHWADQASLDLLRYLARYAAEHRILLIATYRVDEVARQHPLSRFLPALVRESHAERVELRHLDYSAVHELTRRQFGLEDSVLDQLVPHLVHRAEGNPLFTEELLRTLVHDGTLRQVENQWTLGTLPRGSVPTLIRQMVDRRVSGLSEQALHGIQIAAVIGQVVPIRLWESILDPETVSTTIEEAIDSYLIGESPAEQGVEFRHSMVREAVYEGISLSKRRTLHQQIGEAYLSDQQADPYRIAWHYRQAGDQRAINWLKHAGERAFETHAWVAAADRLEEALELTPANEDWMEDRGWLLYRIGHLRRYSDPERAVKDLEGALQVARKVQNELLRVQSSLQLGLLQCLTGSIRSGLEQLRSGASALQRLHSMDWDEHSRRNARLFLVWLGAVGPHKELIPIAERHLPDGDSDLGTAYWGLGWSFAATGRPDDAHRAFTEAENDLNAMNDTVNLGNSAFAHLTEVIVPYYTDDFEERRRVSDLIYHDWTRGVSGLGDAFDARLAYVEQLILEGNWNEAKSVLLGTSRTLSQFRQYASSRLAWLHHHQGNDDLAWAEINATLPSGSGTRPGDCFFNYVIRLHRLAATLELQNGDTRAAADWLEAHDDWLDWSGATLGLAESLLLWAKLDAAKGDPEQAVEITHRALDAASAPRQPIALIAAHRFRGELATHSGELEIAAEHLQTSREIADRCDLPFERALTMLAQAELAIATGELNQARGLLSEVRHVCTELGAKPALQRADKLLARLAPGSSRHAAGLSRRELEVLRRLVSGMSDREIAEDLFISYRTVTNHVSSILRKLDVDSRTAAATRAVREDLV